MLKYFTRIGSREKTHLLFARVTVSLKINFCLSIICLLLGACSGDARKGTFGYDISFLSPRIETHILTAEEGRCQVLLAPDYQGRVMSSTAQGSEGRSYGWINHELISSGELQPKINAVGGEDRFWLGPEGGQYSIFFQSGDAFEFDNWQTPAVLNTEPFDMITATANRASFEKSFKLTNYQGFLFDLKVEREIQIFSQQEIEEKLGITLDSDCHFVGYQSRNKVTNQNEMAWNKDNGLLSIWILGMFTPSDETAILLPYRDSLQLNTAYFGPVDNSRLQADNKVVYFKGDGKYRSKIGLPPANATGLLGSYDPVNQVLTIVEHSFDQDSLYVNSLWKHHENPYRGDVVNAYNDGPLEDGSQLGPFYELESSSSAKSLKPGESMTHTHATFHFEGDKGAIHRVAQEVLGIDLSQIPF